MSWLAQSLAAFTAAATALHLASCWVTAYRARRASGVVELATDRPRAVSIVRPVRGLDAIERETLASSFVLSGPDIELIFCCATTDDPVVAFLRHLIAAHPGADAKLLIGDDLGTANPKLNNVAKGWWATKHPWVVLADSNVLISADYVERLGAGWRDDTGLVCAPPIGAGPVGFWAEVECAFLDTYQARWQYTADFLGLGFAQGKNMLWRKADLDAWGGIAALAAELAEDAAATKLVRAAGKRVRLADPSFLQLLGPRSAKDVIGRQIRWAQLRRKTFPACFAPEILTGSLLPVVAAGTAAHLIGYDAATTALGLLSFWLAVEAALAYTAGWHLSWRSPLAWIVRDLAIPVVYLNGWLARRYEWRGNRIDVSVSIAIEGR